MSLKIISLLLFALACFAGNSLLCRSALGQGRIDAVSFTFVRLFFGTLTLLVLLQIRPGTNSKWKTPNWPASGALAGYAIFFSLAYVRIDAGIGALVLFTAVQMSMIGWNAIKIKRPTGKEVTGVLLALAGLAVLTLPGKQVPDFIGSFLMVGAGVCWGAYCILGLRVSDPTLATGTNFAGALLLLLPVALIWRGSVAPFYTSGLGITLAAISGAVTSGIGYRVWYATVPHLKANQGAIVQLAVPVIATAGAAIFLGETISWRLVAAGLLILGGVGLVFLKR